MPVYLTVYKKNEDEPMFEKVSESDIISIGRDRSCDLTLKDPSKYVSRQHAVIQCQDGYYYLMDKESRNGTYINNRRIKADYPYTLDDGTEFVIGEYTIQFSLVEESAAKGPPPADRTVVDSSPFQEEIDSILRLLAKIEHKHITHKELATKESLAEAFSSVQSELTGYETGQVIAASFNSSNSSGEMVPEQMKKPESEIQGYDRVQKVLDLLLEHFVRLFRFVSKFRTEFVGSTLVESENTISNQNKDRLKQLLFDPEATQEESEKRIAQLHSQLQKLIAHQMGLLDGYKDSVNQGVPHLLRELNPDITMKEVARESQSLGLIKIPLKYLPFRVKNKTLQHLKEKHFQLTDENRGVLEKKIFRPLFIKKYLETVSSS